MDPLPDVVRVRIETPRGGTVKWRATGEVDYVSPLPSPFNYGCVPGTLSPDGDPLDALVLGPRLPAGHEGAHLVWGWVDFVDDGQADPKLVCGPSAPTRLDRLRLQAFFRAYARFKAVLNRVRGGRGATALRGVQVGR